MKKKIDLWEAENIFYQKSHPIRISKFICHYEIFKKVMKVKGDIFEFGVFKGASLSRFCKFNELYKTKKRIFGFDAFGNFPISGLEDDIKFAKKHDKQIGLGISKKLLSNNLKNSGQPF